MGYQTYRCLDCGDRIEESDTPVVIRLSVGTAEIPGQPPADPRDLLLPLDAWQRLQFEKPSETDICVTCYAWDRKVPLLDHKGRQAADPTKHAKKEDFVKAVKAEIKSRKDR
jgi:hypothetical protein